jgi:drug/metabolite transporter (DMT)-like permease
MHQIEFTIFSRMCRCHPIPNSRATHGMSLGSRKRPIWPPGGSTNVSKSQIADSGQTLSGPVMTRLTASWVLLLAALCWGAGNVANKTVLQHLDPLTVMSLRCVLAALVIGPFAIPDLRQAANRDWIKSAVGLSIPFAAALLLQQWAYGLTSVTNAGFLVNTATVMTPVLAWLLWGHRIGLAVTCAAPLTLVGALLMSGGHMSWAAINGGDLLCLASAAGYAVWMVALGRHAVRYGRPLGTTFVQFAVSAVLVLPVALWIKIPDFATLGQAAPDLFMLGVISTALAFGLMTWAQRYVTAPTAAIIVSAEGVFGALGARLVLGEQTSVIGICGAGLILCAIAIVALYDRVQHTPMQPGPNVAKVPPGTTC